LVSCSPLRKQRDEGRSSSHPSLRSPDCVTTSAERRRRAFIFSLGQRPRIDWTGWDRTEGPIHRSGFQPFPTPPDRPGPMARAGNEAGRWPLMLGQIVEPKFSQSPFRAGPRQKPEVECAAPPRGPVRPHPPKEKPPRGFPRGGVVFFSRSA
jgi:hypothetical protein